MKATETAESAGERGARRARSACALGRTCSWSWGRGDAKEGRPCQWGLWSGHGVQ